MSLWAVGVRARAHLGRERVRRDRTRDGEGDEHPQAREADVTALEAHRGGRDGAVREVGVHVAVQDLDELRDVRKGLREREDVARGALLVEHFGERGGGHGLRRDAEAAVGRDRGAEGDDEVFVRHRCSCRADGLARGLELVGREAVVGEHPEGDGARDLAVLRAEDLRRGRPSVAKASTSKRPLMRLPGARPTLWPCDVPDGHRGAAPYKRRARPHNAQLHAGIARMTGVRWVAQRGVARRLPPWGGVW